MRKLTLPVVGDYNYTDLLTAFLLKPRESLPYSFHEYRHALKVLDKLALKEEQILLEDAEHQFLKARFEGSLYSVADKGLMDFIEHVLAAPAVLARDVTTKE